MKDINKILFVDDEPAVRDGLRRALRDHRQVWDMTFAGGVDEAMEKNLEICFDAIVTDITMPEKDGFELLRLIRNTEQTKDIPVIILTGLGEKSLKKKALDMGATDLLNKPVDREELLARLRSALRLKSYQDEIKSYNATLEKKVAERTKALTDSHLDIILRLGKISEFRDQRMGNHGLKTAYYSRVIGKTLGLEKNILETLFLSSSLHDIGKFIVPEKILLKPGKLTFEEWGMMRQHCEVGASLLGGKAEDQRMIHSLEQDNTAPSRGTYENPLLKMAATIALTHHESWDGKGYPNGISGDNIPLESRIVALADAYDDLTSERPYKTQTSEERTLTLIRMKVGSQFDPEVYSAFDKSLEELRGIQKVFSEQVLSVAGNL